MSAFFIRMQPCDTRPAGARARWCRGCPQSRRRASRSGFPSARSCRMRGAVDRARVALEAIPDVEPAAWGRPLCLADADRSAKDHASLPQEGGRECMKVDDQVRSHDAVTAESLPRDPPGSPVRQRGKADAHPQPPGPVAAAPDHGHDVRRALRRPGLDLRNPRGNRARPSEGRRRSTHDSPRRGTVLLERGGSGHLERGIGRGGQIRSADGGGCGSHRRVFAGSDEPHRERGRECERRGDAGRDARSEHPQPV
jgi:hypothetical protein